LVDETTLIVISTVVQTVVITVTLIVFVLQFRSQEKAIRESSYQGLMGRYNQMLSSMIDKPELAYSLFMGLPSSRGANVSKDDAALYGHLLLAYGIIEEAYLLYKKKWISEGDWLQWSAFLERLAGHPLFITIHRFSSGTFDEDYEKYINEKILKQDNETSFEEKK
jgi:hypothetical protein